MKILSTVFLLLHAIVPVTANLRGASLHEETNDSSSSSLAADPEQVGYASATIYIEQVKTSGDWDDEIVSNAFITAYNTAHSNSDYSIKSGFIDNKVEIPEDNENTHYYSISWYSFTYGKHET